MIINNKELHNLHKSIKAENYTGIYGLYIEGFDGGITAYVTDGKACYRKTFYGDNKGAFVSYIDNWKKKDGVTDVSDFTPLLGRLGNKDDRNFLPKMKAYFEKERFNVFTVNAAEFKKAVRGVDAINRGERYRNIVLSIHNGKFDIASWNYISSVSWQLDGEYSGNGAVMVNKKYLDGAKSDKTLEFSFSRQYPEEIKNNGVILHIHGDIDAVICPIRLEGDNLIMFKEVLEYENNMLEKPVIENFEKTANKEQAKKIMSEINVMTNEDDLRKELVKLVIEQKPERKPVKRVPRLKKENGAFTGWKYNELGTKQIKICNW